MKRISYFTYWEPAHDEHWQWTNAMCDTEGNRMQHYYDVQRINKTVRPIGEYLFGRTSAAVYHIGMPEAGTKVFAGFGKVQAIAGEGGVLGCFDDGTMYLVNRDFLKDNTFTLQADAPMTVWQDGCFVDLPDTTITLAPGEAVLLK